MRRVTVCLIITSFLLLALVPSLAAQEGLGDSFSDSGSSSEPPSVTIDTELAADGSLTPGETVRLSVHYTLPDGYHQIKQEEYFNFSVPSSAPVVLREINYPEGTVKEGMVNYYGSVTLAGTAQVKQGISPGTYRVPLTVSYQLCEDGGACLFPQEETHTVELTVAGEEAGGTGSGAASSGTPSPDKAAASGAETAAGEASGRAGLSLGALLRYLLFAFIGGLLLNVMPCVLPVLSLRALNLVKQSGNSRREIFTGSLLYTAGILISLLALAAVVIALKISGELVGWGFQFQNPLFVVILTALVFAFSLSLFDVYVFQAPVMGGSIQKAQSKGFLGAFFNGIIAVILAMPCTAPLLGTALGFAFTQPPIIILSLFAVIGLGFASPFLLLGVKPGLVHRLPKPGPWMNTFKELMGFVLIGTVIYLLSILGSLVDTASMIRVLLFLFSLAVLLWGYGKLVQPASGTRRKWIILGLFVILTVSAAGWFVRPEQLETPSQVQQLHDGWERFDPGQLAEYRQRGEPVFVIFSAEWCSVCSLNEKTVLYTDRADELFADRGIHVLYGDYTTGDPLIERWIRAYGRAGVPVYAYYPPGSETAALLPEVLTIGLLEQRLTVGDTAKTD
jgi:thiol:disulfide interchange protein DsbD